MEAFEMGVMDGNKAGMGETRLEQVGRDLIGI